MSFADMAAALSLIVRWACSSPDIRSVVGRIATLQVLLDPVKRPTGDGHRVTW